MNIYLFDLEMSNLNADYGMVLCGVIKKMNTGKRWIYRVDGYKRYKLAPWDDSKLVMDLRDKLNEAEIIVSWNGKRFDVPFLNSRLMFHRLPIFEPQMHLDLLYISRYKLKISSNSLDTISRYLQIPTKKTRINGSHWAKAMTGDTKSMDYIVRHCMKDVDVLGSVLSELKGLIKYIQ